MTGRGGARPLLSIVTTAFNEELNLPLLYQELFRVTGAMDVDVEWIIVDDHSRDNTYGVIAQLAASDPRVRGVRLSRNVGSHVAQFCGFSHARGDCLAPMAADLQHPPALLPELVERWRAGSQITWVARAGREGEAASVVAFSRLYFWIMRRFVGLSTMPATGADFFLMDRAAADALLQFQEANVNTLALLTWIGFRQETISYDRPPRRHGKSGWSLEKKIKLVVDSVTAFTYKPIRLMSYAGLCFATLGFAYAALILYTKATGHPVEGWASLMVVVLVGGGLEMLMIGVLGEYLWRALDESRRRPRYFVEASTPGDPRV